VGAIIEESGSNHPTGEGAIIEITDQPHTGCAKFSQRFGTEVPRFVNSEVGKELRLRGVNARVVVPGTIRPGDMIRKL
jgi:MOSC domain-containing protein YiiM